MSLRGLVPESWKDAVGRPLGLRGVSAQVQWQRIAMNDAIDAWIRAHDPRTRSAVEVSGSERSHHPWAVYKRLDYPEFDLCADAVSIEEEFDIVVCEQVLEHVVDPWLALERLKNLARPGGYVIVSTPFLIRVHAGPGDYWRFTEDGLRLIVERSGLQVAESGAWGNRRCVRANLRRWAKRRIWSSMRNDSRFPVAVWAIARRP